MKLPIKKEINSFGDESNSHCTTPQKKQKNTETYAKPVSFLLGILLKYSVKYCKCENLDDRSVK